MVHISARARAVKNIDSKIARLRRTLFLRASREWTIALLRKRHEILSHRYYKRSSYGPTFRPKEDSPLTRALFQQTEEKHRIDFRMTISEMADLVELFGKDEVFARKGKKPQAPPIYQLGLLVHRLAHGHEVHTIRTKFGIGRMSILPSPLPCLCLPLQWVLYTYGPTALLSLSSDSSLSTSHGPFPDDVTLQHPSLLPRMVFPTSWASLMAQTSFSSVLRRVELYPVPSSATRNDMGST
jgi:hypothetical protein